MSLEPVDDGELAAVVTYLEMTVRPDFPEPAPSPLRLERLAPSNDDYRTLFKRVGERWLWFSRLVMAEDALAAILGDDKVHIFAVMDEMGATVGLVELDFRVAGACEIAFLGLVPALAGKGHGEWLLRETLRRAWADHVSRVHVHTCSLDHPAALPAYRRAGFVATRRAIERFADPRRIGILRKDCAPQVPLLGTDALTSATPAES